jgi:hypothetical protein
MTKMMTNRISLLVGLSKQRRPAAKHEGADDRCCEWSQRSPRVAANRYFVAVC